MCCTSTAGNHLIPLVWPPSPQATPDGSPASQLNDPPPFTIDALLAAGQGFSLFAAEAPRHHTAISLQCSKGCSRGVDVLHIYELTLNIFDIILASTSTPGHHRAICLQCGKSGIGRVDVLDIYQLCLDTAAVSTMIRICWLRNCCRGCCHCWLHNCCCWCWTCWL